MLFLIPFFHPLTSIQLCFTFFIIGILLYLLCDKVTNKPSRFFIPGFLVFTTFMAWILNQFFFRYTVRSLYNWFSFEIGSVPILKYQESFNKANLSIIDFFNMLLNSYGHQIIYVCLALVGFILIIREYLFSKKHIKMKKHFLPVYLLYFVWSFSPFYLVH